MELTVKTHTHERRRMTDRKIETRKVSDLQPHPYQSRIYVDHQPPDLEDQADFFKSVKDNGVLHPLLVTHENIIISGHRRWEAAKRAGQEVVPVEVFWSHDDLDIRAALVHANKVRKKSRYMLACEAQVLLEIEQERARRRKTEGQKAGGQARHGSLPEPVPGSSDRGEAADKVGAAMNPPLSGKTVRQAVEVAKTIEKLEREGKGKEAERLKTTLNEKGFKPAAQEVRKKKEGKTQAPAGSKLDFERADRLLGQLGAVLRELVKKPGGLEAVSAWCKRNMVEYLMVITKGR
jgi:ParB-like chromosome segregation protein Spo0J